MKSIRFLALAAVFLIVPTAHAAFSDVTPSDWFHDYIVELAEQGVVGGNPDGTFRPNNQISRAELAKIAVNIAKKSGMITSDSTAGAPAFQDVLQGSWYEESVLLGAKNRIFEGYKNPDGSLTGFFKPQNMVTRAEAIKVLLNAADVRPKTEPMEPFTDVASEAWYAGYITTAFNWNIVDGYRNTSGNLTGMFGPNDPVTRGQAAKIGVLALDPQ